VAFGDQSLPESESIDASPFPSPEQYLQYLYPPPPRPSSWRQHGRAISSVIAAVTMIGLVIVLAIVTGPPSSNKRSAPTGLDTTMATARTSAAGHGSTKDNGSGDGGIEATSVAPGASLVSSAPTPALTPSRTFTATKTTAGRTTVAAPNPGGCHPRSTAGNCYEAGQFCAAADQGAAGVSGDGSSIQCESNDGLRWEPVDASVQSSSSMAPTAPTLSPTTSASVTTSAPITTAATTAMTTATDSDTASATATPTGADTSSP
jgi:hypothetical protein